MAAFKLEEIAPIVKKKSVGYDIKNEKKEKVGRVEYKHETLDQVVDVVREPMAKHGLSHSWDVEQKNKEIHVSCVITHAAGHTGKPVKMFGFPDDSGRKNPLQQVRSTITFLQRATLLLALGLAAKGEDNDGRGSLKPNQAPDPVGSSDDAPRRSTTKKAGSSAPRAKASSNGAAKLNAGQLHLLRAKLERSKRDETSVLDEFKVESLDALPFERLNDALQFIDEGGAR
jgi:hypothetical protein